MTDRLAAIRAHLMRGHDIFHAEDVAWLIAELVTGNCRGGFSAGELIAFLYARSFPKSEWRARVDEAFHGMEDL
jgi:hypothetical protein